MKKKLIVLFLLSVSVVFSEQKISEKLDNFVKEFDTYYPHPNWIMKQHLLKMDLNDVEIAFNFLVAELYKISTRWHYLYDDQSQFKEDHLDRKDLLEHFKAIDSWLSKVAVNEADKSLIVLEKESDSKGYFRLNGSRVLLLKEYLRKKAPNSFADLYALYYKYLTEEYFDKCKEFNTRSKSLSLARKELYSVFYEIEKILTNCLLGTRYEKDALYQFERYELILGLLDRP
ncbi:hypothetical protein A3F66_05720 [candidate division TM6 bacterium RIFCSPHIGHO2_12_FULL_32_22]|nr:MAG: hypothetical protein A3F66_05720 [candidate division TM6 bacterium RIFCSPHIGHO2_12_FULL_32_22]